MLKVYNTLTRKKEEFRPLNNNKVGMYVCGPTVYDYCHVGHARSYVAFDVIRRYLEFRGYKVTYVQNFTDVDDRIIERAMELSVEPLKLSKRFIEEYFRDITPLNVKRADIYPKVTEHIEDIIKVVKGLIEKGFAYEVDGNVYFDVTKVKDYGKLSHQSLEDMKAGARVEVDENKRHPMDFALWKKSKGREIGWESPWGKGRPGWHIECSTMSTKYLGETLDIHGGGTDLIFPHHENEILQAEAYTGKEFCRYWLHNGFITINKEKMSKSLGNFFTIREVLERYPPNVLRFFLIYTHYRKVIEFSDKQLDEAKVAYEKLQNTLGMLKAMLKNAEEEISDSEKRLLDLLPDVERRFIEAMDDDFNTREAISTLFELSREINSAVNEGILRSKMAIEEILGLFSKLDTVLGIFEEKKVDSELSSNLIELVLEIREEARKNKDYKTADKIRDKLREIGIIIEDTKDGTRWRLA